MMPVAVVKTDPLLRLADSYIPRFAETFRRSVERIRERVTLQAVAEDLDLTRQPRNLFALLDSLEIAKAEDRPIAQLIAEAASLEAGMSVQSPFVQEAARRLTANLVTGVGEETKRALRRILFEAIRDGDAPAVARKTIQRIIGLDERSALALKRFSDQQMRQATTARLRQAAERRVDRYTARLLRDRALNIARTETIRAGNVGRVEGWRQMASDGLIDTSRFSERWLVTPDDRLCDRCAPMNGLTTSLGGSFEESQRGVLPSVRTAVAGVTVETPPLHPRCRCTLVAEFG